MNHNVKILDGALGTMLWEMSGTNGDVWQLNTTHSDIVEKLHKLYIEAGSQIIASNTFSANHFSVKNSKNTVAEIVSAGVRIAKSAVENTDVKVALDIGPLSELIEPYGDLTAEECEQAYREIIDAGVKENPDIIFFETFMDVEMLKIAVSVATEYKLPILCSMTFEPVGRTMMGNTVEDMVKALEGYPVVAMGLNCSNVPSSLMGVIREFREYTDKPLIFKPNAGLPQQQDGKNVYKSDEEIFAQEMLPVLELGEVYIGSCCGTRPSYIKKLTEMI